MATDRPSVHLLAFELSSRRLALPVELLETIVRAADSTPLPEAPSFVEGIVHLRGQLLPVIDLRRRFGLPPAPPSPDQLFLVIRGLDSARAIRVDEVHNIFAVPAEALEHAREIVPGAGQAPGIARLPDGMLVVQDPEALLTSDDEGRLEAALEAGGAAARQADAELALRQQKEFLSTVIANSPSLIFVKDWEGRFVLANEAVARLYGTTVEELIGRTEADFNPDQREVARALAEEREVMTTLQARNLPEQQVMAADGGTRWLESVKVPLNSRDGLSPQVLGVATDVTERKLLEQQVRLAQKLEAVGTLAGGVAHDFNNVLAAIRASVDLAVLQLDADSPLRAELQEVAGMVDRGAGLTRQLLAFSRRQVLEARPLALDQLVAQTLKMLERIIGADIRISVDYPTVSCVVMADPGQLEQALMNLCVNARDAMPDGGRIALRVDRTVIDQDFCALHPWAREGEFVCLTVADTGVGMSAETQARIFEPFFTTKEPGRGTGLGLAVVYGIVRQHGGMVQVSSEPGQGTTFRLYFPYAAQEVGDDQPEPPADSIGGDETILLAEDDRVLRNATARLLSRLGYRIVPVATGKEALDTIHALGAEIDLAILDLVMPELNGRTVFDAVRTRFPQLRFLFTTGYSTASLHLEGMVALSVPVLHKPYGFHDLARAVRRAIELVPR
ncbi:MAG TPA: chemotaxis protein CheW [Gemmatimonadales bacterium]